MLRITTPKDIVWGEIGTNKIVTDIINGISDSLAKNNAFINNEFNYSVQLSERLSSRDNSLLKFAFSEYGWNINSSSSIKEDSVVYNFKLIVSNPIFL